MLGFCPNCEDSREVDVIEEKREITVRGEVFLVNYRLVQCDTCKVKYDDPEISNDPLAEAYDQYRDKHGYVKASEIKEFRKKYGLSQVELGKILGFGSVTLSRYENGALQDEAYDTLLKMIMTPTSFLQLLETRHDFGMSCDKRDKLIAGLRLANEEECNFEKVAADFLGKYPASEYSGFLKLNLDKFYNAILFFCRSGVLKTKLNKLMFYADFKHQKDFGVGITGMQYARLPYGPVPDKYDHHYAMMINELDILSVDEIYYPDGNVGEQYTSSIAPDLSSFSKSELETLEFVAKRFGSFTAKEISDFSHEEEGYKHTPMRKFISFEYAKSLHI